MNYIFNTFIAFRFSILKIEKQTQTAAKNYSLSVDCSMGTTKAIWNASTVWQINKWTKQFSVSIDYSYRFIRISEHNLYEMTQIPFGNSINRLFSHSIIVDSHLFRIRKLIHWKEIKLDTCYCWCQTMQPHCFRNLFCARNAAQTTKLW